MIELVADRLVLVDNGTAQPFDGSLEDYTDIILRKADGNGGGNGGSGGDAPKTDRKAEKRNAAQWRERQRAATNAVRRAATEMPALAPQRSRQTGRASCREREWPYGSIAVPAGQIKK